MLDLSDRVRTTAYEHPESLKERVHLTTGGDYWPYATSTNRHVDYDHPTPYDDRPAHPGRPGPDRHPQLRPARPTTPPLEDPRRPPRPTMRRQGRYVWLTPHGLGFLVDHRGTHRISTRHARMILDAPPGVDIYPT